MKISGKTIAIRPFRDSDVSAFYHAASESIDHVQAFLPWCHSDYAISDSEEWVLSRQKAWDAGEEYSFVIVDKADTDILGGVGINQINKQHQLGNLGYWVRKSALGKGVAKEAALLMASFGFEQLGLTRIEIVTLVDNIPSRRVAERTGAHYEGILRKRIVMPDAVHDACMYSLTESVDC